MSTIVYIGVDDTDVIGSPGTGKVARGLAKHLADLGLAESLGVSRHQLLVHPQVKYTSHNSSKGLAVKTDRPVPELYQPSVSYVESCAVTGSDPGLCICPEGKVTAEILTYGLSAETVLLTKQDALALAAKHKIFLRELGGDGGGIIGALAAVGLRASGNNGRLVDTRGVRDIKGVVSVAEIKQRTDIVSVQDAQGRVFGDNELIDSLDWIRPSLVGGQAVLRVKPIRKEGREIWVPAEKKLKEEHKEEEHRDE